MDQGYRCISRVVSHKRLSICYFLKLTQWPLQQGIKGKIDRAIKSSSSEGNDHHTLTVEYALKEGTTLFPPLGRSHSEFPKPDCVHCPNVSKEVWIGRNRKIFDRYHDRSFLGKSPRPWQSTNSTFSGLALCCGPAFHWPRAITVFLLCSS